MAEGNRRLLETSPDKAGYSAMEVENPESTSSGSHLVDSDEPQSSLKINKRALVVFFGVTTLAAAVIIVAVFVTLYSGQNSANSRSKRDYATYTMDDMLSGTYNPRQYRVTWLSDDKYMIRGEGGSIDIINLSLNNSETLVSADNAEHLSNDFLLSPNNEWILYSKHKKMQYRYSSLADYYVYNVKNNDSQQILTNENTRIQYVRWAPSGNSLVYVTKNDMYYIRNVQKPLPPSHRLTDSGREHLIFNGVPDWVYQEEILNSDNALYFSTDGRYITYIQFNDTKVKNFVFPWYGDPSNEYTSQHRIAYPKPGYPNPTVKVQVIDLDNLPSNKNIPPLAVEVQKPAKIDAVEHYVVAIGWPSSLLFSIQWITRDQNFSITDLCEPKADKITCTRGHDQQVSNGWIDDRYMTPFFGPGYYLLMFPTPQGSDGNFIHIVKFKDSTITPITSGKWEVTAIHAFDEKREIVFFDSTEESPTKRHIYSVSIQDRKKTCLSCRVKSQESTYFAAQFSKKGTWYILNSQGPGIPWFKLYSSKDPNIDIILELNDALKQKMEKLPMGLTKFVQVKSGGYDINAKIVYPPAFDERKKYAVLFSVYGGPGTQNVLETWGLGYETGYLVHNYDIIMVYVDARGTMGRGERFKHAVYHELGKYESTDTISVAKYMQTLPYVAGDKIAIWGWSYGGYLSSYVLGQNSGVFKLAIAVAPVADWRYYDSIYTERYMGLPTYNKKGYDESSVLPLIKNFKNHDYLVVHGTGDDNVHFQNSAQLVRKLTEEQIDYRVQFYPDKNHGLSGEGTSRHLYHLLTEFMTEKEHIKASNSS